MRFVVRKGTDPVARADTTILKALGLPFGGVLKVGRTHFLVQGGDTPESTALELGPITLANAQTSEGQSIDAVRAVLGPAEVVVIDVENLEVDPKLLVRGLQGRPMSNGDRVEVAGSYLSRPEPFAFAVNQVDPAGAGLIGAGTRFVSRSEESTSSLKPEASSPKPQASSLKPETSRSEPDVPAGPTTAQALLAGLDAEQDLLTGWLSLLTSPDNLPATWGLPRVAGVLLEGPHGCGKSELVAASAAESGARVHEVLVDQVFKPDRLLDLLEAAVKSSSGPTVIFVDRLEAVAGEEGLAPFKTQVGAVLRWFLDAVSEKIGLACVLGVTSRSNLDPALAQSPLLPRSLSIPPPDLNRRRLLFEAALTLVPTEEIDYDLLAARSAGFSGADVVASVIHASTRLARSARSGHPGKLTTEDIMEAVKETTPSLGSISLGEMPNYGFDRVANLNEVKQRLIEAVVWPVTEPDRFKSMGIDPPRGILLYGPPGTGKTFVIRALAHEAGAAFFPVKGAELLDKYVGESERGVREVFARARAAAPSIIFFDEIDALAPVRGRSTTNVTDSVVAALLTEMDGITDRGNVAVIGATNRADLIDPALLRAGRFETQIELGLPDPKARRALIDLSDVPFAPEVDKEKLADVTEGMSMADLSGVLREAALAALRADRNAKQVSWEHLIGAIERWQRSQAAAS
ncbi:MAG TPA: AAA family ATPase [Acidimicrobiia bacterium]|nr:AAA family ATPase [Acidimicrobiia bacterium]